MRVFVLWALIWASTQLHAQTIEHSILDATSYPVSLSPFISAYEDASKEFTLDDIISIPKSKWQNHFIGTPSFGFSESHYWVRFDLQNNREAPHALLLELAYPLMDKVLFFAPDPDSPNGWIISRTGDSLPFSSRNYQHRNFIFPITLPPLSNSTFYLRLNGRDTIEAPLRLWEPDVFRTYDHHVQMAFGCFYGAMLVMVLFNFFVYFALKDMSFLYYVGSIICFTVVQAALNGFSYEYLLSDFPEFNKFIRPFLMNITMFFVLLFTMSYLNSKQHAPRMHYVLWLSLVCASILTLCVPFITFTPFIQGSMINTGIGLIALLSVGFIALYHKFRPALFFVLAWAGFIVGCFISILRAFALLPSTPFTEFGLQFGSLLVAFFLSFGLSDRINLERRSKFKAQAAALENERLARMEQERATKIQLESKEVEFQARQLAVAAQAESRAKSDFLATMSHEIRTPMNGVLGVAELLKDTVLDEQQQRYVNTIHKSGESLLTVLNDVLDFSKIEAGKMAIERINFSIETLIDDVISINSFPATEKRLTLTGVINREVPHTLKGDPTRTRQILLNLVGNALKFTDRGEITIRVLMQQQQVRFEISDTGIGISKDKQESLFQSFSQADKSTTRRYGGTGLGLAICKRLAELMGGEIGVTSERGQGSRFWFTIKNHVAKDEAELPAPFAGKSLLLIDNNLRFLEFISEQCARWNIQLRTIATAEQIAGVDDLTFDAVLCHIKYAEDAKHICAQYPHLFLADFAKRESKDGHKVLQKPLTMGRLFDELNHLFGTKIDEPKKANTEIELFSHLNVLVAEDNNVNQLVIKGILNKLGVSPRFAQNGLEAFESVRSSPNHFDLIFMDCEMPVMDGYESTMAIRDYENSINNRHLIIGLSAHAVAERRDRAFDSGMDEYITKPVQIKEVRQMLEIAAEKAAPAAPQAVSN